MLKRRVARFAFHLLRRFPRLAQTLLPWSLTHMSFAIPLHKLRQTPSLLAFDHPQPGYPVHVLIVPRRAIASLADLTAQDAPLLVEVFQTAQSLVAELGLEKGGYRLIVNGGAYQDLPQLHWHLVAD
jgi:histidine triad (HIT) family protein